MDPRFEVLELFTAFRFGEDFDLVTLVFAEARFLVCAACALAVFAEARFLGGGDFVFADRRLFAEL